MEQQRNGCCEDEISLIDLLLVLLKWKWVAISSTLLGLLIATVMIFGGDTVKRHEFRTVLEIGAVMTPTGVRPLDEPENLVAKIENTYITAAHAITNTHFGVSVDNPRKSNIVILTSKGSLDKQQGFETLHQTIAEQVIGDLRTAESEANEALIKKSTVIAPTNITKYSDKEKSPLLIMTLGVILGLMVGIFGSFFLEFAVNARAEIRRRSHSG